MSLVSSPFLCGSFHVHPAKFEPSLKTNALNFKTLLENNTQACPLVLSLICSHEYTQLPHNPTMFIKAHVFFTEWHMSNHLHLIQISDPAASPTSHMFLNDNFTVRTECFSWKLLNCRSLKHTCSCCTRLSLSFSYSVQTVPPPTQGSPTILLVESLWLLLKGFICYLSKDNWPHGAVTAWIWTMAPHGLTEWPWALDLASSRSYFNYKVGNRNTAVTESRGENWTN